MPIMRNPFRTKPTDVVHEDGSRPPGAGADNTLNKTDGWSSRVKPMSVRTNSSANSDPKPTEYKMSEINDDGAFVPPSPPEKKGSFWSTKSAAATRSTSTLNEHEPFNISRESFDSYRRSFDISARSPILAANSPRPRQSLDARALRLPSSGISGSPNQKYYTHRASSDASRPRRPSATPYQPHPKVLPDKFINPPEAQPEESEDAVSTQTSPSTSATTEDASTNPTTPSDSVADRFEDVGLGEPVSTGQSETTAKKQQTPHPAKRPGIFARFGGSSEANAPSKDENSNPNLKPASSGIGIGLGMFGRKRGASGQGAELGSIQQPQTNGYAHGKKGSVSSATAGAPEVRTDA